MDEFHISFIENIINAALNGEEIDRADLLKCLDHLQEFRQYKRRQFNEDQLKQFKVKWPDDVY